MRHGSHFICLFKAHAVVMFASGMGLLSVGCGPGKLLDRPADMPAELGGRKLWHTERAFIYAANEATAGETNRWIGEIARHVHRAYGAELGKGLVIVIDDKEPPFIDSLDELVRLQTRTARAAGVERHEMPNEEAQRQKLQDAEMSEELVCRVTPFELDATVMTASGLPSKLPDDVAWCISCPSHALMEASMWEFGPKAIEKKQGKAFAVATMWAWPLAFAEASKGFRLGRDVLVFELWTIRQESWDSKKRSQEIDRYTEQRAVVLSPTLALAMKMAREGKDGSKPVTSQPADPDG